MHKMFYATHHSSWGLELVAHELNLGSLCLISGIPTVLTVQN
jgi:hypothetical protein